MDRRNGRKKIAFAGATGGLSRHIVDVLEERGYDVVAMSRSLGVDVVTGEALAEALEGWITAQDRCFQWERSRSFPLRQ